MNIELAMLTLDKEDINYVHLHTWHLPKGRGGIRTTIGGKTVVLSRYILGVTDPNVVVDHINGNRFDNRKCNLRVCTDRQNRWNRDSSRKYKGVDFHKRTGKYRARIRVDGKLIHLGLFNTEEEAAEAYNTAALKYFGEFARLNSLPSNPLTKKGQSLATSSNPT